jgi:molybdate transport system regulatory protein
MDELTATFRFRLWLETPNGTVFGKGRVLLLMKIEEHGSLNRAARELGMSYRAAWGKLKHSESILGFPLCNKCRGRLGYTLTDDGRRVLNEFIQWHAEVERHALESARRLLPWKIVPEMARE